MSVARGLSILLVSSKNQLFVVLIFWIVFLFSISFNSTLIFVLYFFSQSSNEGMPIDERERERETLGEGETSTWEKHWLVASLMCPIFRLYPRIRYVPWLGIKSTTLFCTDQHSSLPNHSARGPLLVVIFPLFCCLWARGGFFFCSSLRHCIRSFTWGFSFLDISL